MTPEAQREGMRVCSERSGPVERTTVTIETERAAQTMQRPCGQYVTLGFEQAPQLDLELRDALQRELAAALAPLLPREGGVLVVGLGNPGDKYENTRHNVGFLTVDVLAERARVPVQKLKHRALTNTVELGGARVLLMKPVTYMNLSGEAVGEAARFYKIPPERVLVISDDVSLPIGKLRIRKGGSAGGHNGLKSIIQHLGTDQFPRVKVGVGEKPHPDYDMADWVLGKFVGPDKTAIDEATLRAAQAVECYLKDGPQKAMNQFN